LQVELKSVQANVPLGTIYW